MTKQIPKNRLPQTALLLLVFLCLMLVGACVKQAPSQSASPQSTPPPAVPKVDLSTPEKTIDSFVSALSQGDMNTVIACIVGAEESSFSTHMGKSFSKLHPKITADDMKVIMNGDTATASFTFTMAMKSGEQSSSDVADPDSMFTIDTVKLKREGSDWKIVPGDITTFQTLSSDSVSVYSTLLAYPTFATQTDLGKTFREAEEKTEALTALRNGKHVGVAMMMFVMENGEKFPQKASSYRNDLKPFITSESNFTCPLDEAGATSFTFNKRLEGVPLGSLEWPSQTVMLYEGANEQLSFHHYGNAVVAFTDGSCKLITREEAEDVRWKP